MKEAVTIRKRFKYYGAFYIVGYIISLYGTGIPAWYYLIPVKIVALCLMFIGGSSIYYMAEEKLPFLLAFVKSFKYIAVSFAILLVIALIQHILDINLSALIGI